MWMPVSKVHGKMLSQHTYNACGKFLETHFFTQPKRRLVAIALQLLAMRNGKNGTKNVTVHAKVERSNSTNFLVVKYYFPKSTFARVQFDDST